jgi:hypothetical protein
MARLMTVCLAVCILLAPPAVSENLPRASADGETLDWYRDLAELSGAPRSVYKFFGYPPRALRRVIAS